MTLTTGPMRYVQALGPAFVRFGAKNGWVMSSHVAMSIMLAVFPFLLFVLSLAGVVYHGFDPDVLIELVFGSWPDDIAQPIVAEVRNVLTTSSTGLMTVGGVIAIYFASNGVDAIRLALVQAYHHRDPRPFWRTRLLALGFVIAGGAALLLAGIFEIWLPFYTNAIALAVPGQVASEVTNWFTGVGLSWIVILVLPVIAVLACHMLLTSQRHSLQDILPGVILTLVLWAVAGWGFSVYVSRFASYSATYAGLAGAMSALIFLYLNAAILILGAEYNGALLGYEEDTDAD